MGVLGEGVERGREERIDGETCFDSGVWDV